MREQELFARNPEANPLYIVKYQMYENYWPIQAFKSYKELITFYNTHRHYSDKPRYYEYIHNNKRETYMHFDIEKKYETSLSEDEYARECRTIIDTAITTLNEYIQTFYQGLPILINGHNMQIGWTDYTYDGRTKISFHVKANIIFEDTMVLKNFTTQLINYIIVKGDPIKEVLSYKTPKHNKDGTTSFNTEFAFDTSVYKKRSSSMRALYSSKLGKQAQMLPYENASHNIADHLVIVHKENPQPNTFKFTYTIPNIKPNHPLTQERIAIARRNALRPSLHTVNEQNVEITPDIPQESLDEIEHILKESAIIKITFKTNGYINFTHSKYYRPHIYDFVVDHLTTPIFCPYAQRQHKNNRCFFQYNHTNKTICFRCFDEQSCNVSNPLKYHVCSVSQQLALEDDMCSQNTLHDREDSIPWCETYNEPLMRPYPTTHTIVAIKGNMGTGKTETLLNNTISTYCSHPDTKCLFITYQRILSRKFIKSLAQFGFENYLDAMDASTFSANKLIVCLDSLYRVKTTNFDYIIIDEALSVLLHFQSPLMRNVNEVSLKFEQHLLQAKHIYFIDACVDNMIVYNTIRYISTYKNTKPCWVRNTYVRPTNRKVYLTHASNEGTALTSNATRRIIQLLTNNKRIVVSSSTKRFTEIATKQISALFPNKKIMTYNSATDQSLIFDHAEKVNDTWTQYDIVIYSPTIGAGLSFERPHFHALVAYTENSPGCPTIDLTIQQLYRVRQLIDGEMYIYVNDMVSKECLREEEVDDWLQERAENISKYCEKHNINTELGTNSQKYNNRKRQIEFDRDRLSYEILKGMIYNKYKSYAGYKEIMVNMLSKDYGIPIEYEQLDTSCEHKAIKILKANDYCAESLPYSEDILPDRLTYEALSIRKQETSKGQKTDEAPLTDRERQQVWTYEVVHKILKIDPSKFDKDFYETYVGPYEKQNVARTYELAQALDRHEDFMTKTTKQIQGDFLSKMAKIVGDDDYNIKLYRTKVTESYQKLLEASKMYDEMFGDLKTESKRTLKQQLKQGGYMMYGDVFKERAKRYINSLTDEEFHRMRMLFGVGRRAKKKEEMLLDIDGKGRHINSMINTVMRDGGYIEVVNANKAKRKGARLYGAKTIKIHPDVESLKTYKYEP